MAVGPFPCIGWPASGSHPGPWANTMTASTEEVCVGIWITPEEIIQGSGRNKGYVRKVGMAFYLNHNLTRSGVVRLWWN